MATPTLTAVAVAEPPRRWRCFLPPCSPEVWFDSPMRHPNDAHLSHYLAVHYKRPEVRRG